MAEVPAETHAKAATSPNAKRVAPAKCVSPHAFAPLLIIILHCTIIAELLDQLQFISDFPAAIQHGTAST
jgi:hypothetical protein